MRILIYTSEYPPQNGGIATLCEALAKGLTALGTDVLVVAPSYGNEQRAIDAAARQRVIRTAPGGASCRSLLLNLVTYRPDMVLVATEKAQRQVSRMSGWPYRLGVFVVGTEIIKHFGLAPGDRSEDSCRDVKRLFEQADWILANTHSTARMLPDHLLRRENCVSVVHMGIDLDKLTEIPPAALENDRARWGLEGNRMVLCVARLGPEKGHEMLLRAFARVRQRVSDVVLHIAGDGPCRAALQRQATDLALSDKVVFLGSVTQRELSSQYQLCDVMAMVNPNETFGLVYLEANAFGKPVVGGRVRGVPEAVVDGTTGILVDPNDVDDTAEAMIQLLTNPGRCRAMGEAGRRRVLEQFTHVHMARRLLSELGESRGRLNWLTSLPWVAVKLTQLYGRAIYARVARPRTRQKKASTLRTTTENG